jgi:photosystem II stability/assembly factor-like uncharacterized protein
MHRRAVFAALSLLMLWTRPALTATPWTRVGPDAGVVTVLAAAPSSPSRVYAGLSTGGIFRSVDGGSTWSFAGAGLDLHDTVRALAVDARRPDVVWAATFQGIFRSLNGGASWNLVHRASTETIAQDPVSGALYAGIQSGPMVRSRDGATWQEIAHSPENVASLAFDPFHPGTLYAGALNGMFKSTNGGAKWFRLTRGLPLYPVLAVTLAPGSSRRLYAATGGVPGQVVFRSDDAGARWSAVDGGALVGFISSLTVQPGKQETVWVAAGGRPFRSLDRGATWSPAEAGLPDGSLLTGGSVLTLLAGPSTLLAGTPLGPFRSGDQGTSWALSVRGMQAASISGLALDRLQPNRLWAAAYSSGVFRSATSGNSWARLSGVPPGQGGPFAGPVAADPDHPGTAYLGLLGAIAYTGDAGHHWSTGSPLSCFLAAAIAVDPLAPSVIYTSGYFTDPACGEAPSACAMFRSDDAGKGWTCIRNGLPARADFLAPDPLQDSRVYALLYNPDLLADDVYVSADRGGSWSLLASGIGIFFLAPDPHRPGTLWGGGGREGLLRSDDGGKTWAPWGTGIPQFTNLSTLAFDPVDPDVLYLGTLQRGVFKSTDGGVTWAPLGTGLEGINARYLAIDPRDPRTLYVGTDEAGVLKLQQPGS